MTPQELQSILELGGWGVLAYFAWMLRKDILGLVTGFNESWEKREEAWKDETREHRQALLEREDRRIQQQSDLQSQLVAALNIKENT